MPTPSDKCVILGGGPSLVGFDFSAVERHYTIGINKAFVRFPVRAVYAMDYSFYCWTHQLTEQSAHWIEVTEHWQRFRGTRYLICHSPQQRRDHGDDPSYCFVDKLQDQPVLTSDLSEGIYIGSNSGIGALCLAIALGYKDISLLGYDMKVDADNRKTHWHDGYPSESYEDIEQRTASYIAEFEQLAALIRRRPELQIVNLNPDSALTCFPKARLSGDGRRCRLR